MKLLIKKSLLAICFLFLSFSLQASSIDDRLVGSWQGQRSEEGQCSFIAWKMVRTADGKFNISFYTDPEKKHLIGREKGRWEAENGRFLIFTYGVPTPDIYTYKFIDDNSVKFSNIKRDPSADCMADYEFIDNRSS